MENTTSSGCQNLDIIGEKIFTENVKTNLIAHSEKDLKEITDLFRKLADKNPLFHQQKNIAFGMSTFATQVVSLNKLMKIGLEDQINFASLFVEHTFDPTFFLPEIL